MIEVSHVSRNFGDFRALKKTKLLVNFVITTTVNTQRFTTGSISILINSDVHQTKNVQKLLRLFSMTWIKAATLQKKQAVSFSVQNASASLLTAM